MLTYTTFVGFTGFMVGSAFQHALNGEYTSAVMLLAFAVLDGVFAYSYRPSLERD